MDLIGQIDEQPVEVVAVTHRLPHHAGVYLGDNLVQPDVFGELDLDTEPRLKRDDKSLSVTLLPGCQAVYLELAVTRNNWARVARQRLIQARFVTYRGKQDQLTAIAIVNNNPVGGVENLEQSGHTIYALELVLSNHRGALDRLLAREVATRGDPRLSIEVVENAETPVHLLHHDKRLDRDACRLRGAIVEELRERPCHHVANLIEYQATTDERLRGPMALILGFLGVVIDPQVGVRMALAAKPSICNQGVQTLAIKLAHAIDADVDNLVLTSLTLI